MFLNGFLNRVERRMHREPTEPCSLIGIFIFSFSLPVFCCLSRLAVANAPLPSWWASQQFPLEAASLYLPGSLRSRWWGAVELIHCISQKPGAFWYLCRIRSLAWFETANSLCASQTRLSCLLPSTSAWEGFLWSALLLDGEETAHLQLSATGGSISRYFSIFTKNEKKTALAVFVFLGWQAFLPPPLFLIPAVCQRTICLLGDSLMHTDYQRQNFHWLCYRGNLHFNKVLWQGGNYIFIMSLWHYHLESQSWLISGVY